jgi:hypothetical protein
MNALAKLGANKTVQGVIALASLIGIAWFMWSKVKR